MVVDTAIVEMGERRRVHYNGPKALMDDGVYWPIRGLPGSTENTNCSSNSAALLRDHSGPRR